MTDAQIRDNKKSDKPVQKTPPLITTAGEETEVVREEAGQPEVSWDDSKMTTNFANVVNIQSSAEQVDICFGTNHTWSLTGDRRVKVELTNRVIMSPPAAKRLLNALERVLKKHESRHGRLPVV